MVSPYKENPESRYNKSIQLMAHFDRKDLTAHPLTEYIVERIKWRKIVGPLFYTELILQLFIVIILVLVTILTNDRLVPGGMSFLFSFSFSFLFIIIFFILLDISILKKN